MWGKKSIHVSKQIPYIVSLRNRLAVTKCYFIYLQSFCFWGTVSPSCLHLTLSKNQGDRKESINTVQTGTKPCGRDGSGHLADSMLILNQRFVFILSHYLPINYVSLKSVHCLVYFFS